MNKPTTTTTTTRKASAPAPAPAPANPVGFTLRIAPAQVCPAMLAAAIAAKAWEPSDRNLDTLRGFGYTLKYNPGTGNWSVREPKGAMIRSADIVTIVAEQLKANDRKPERGLYTLTDAFGNSYNPGAIAAMLKGGARVKIEG